MERGRRLTILLCALVVGVFVVVSGAGLGTVGATVVGMNRLGDLKRRAAAHGPSVSGAAGRSRAAAGTPMRTTPTTAPYDSARGAALSPPRATLGVEAVDCACGGALLVGVRVPGPGHTAGLVRGDVVLAVDATRLGSAADLARAFAAVRPGTTVTLAVRHANGARLRLTATPGVLT
ncbi:PDZ domain-containing protein [Streptomyces glomeratus]|uniref:PDZ domain-containing protein n=1 Tax=Streptomyces glomeratus TaxID=284452 RepID=A0ABP6LVD1_9ACTN|nr:PDZ domain-containing protein [Streptomyces glomeratus]MCF1507738.1 PDZ domain-containing protein [Streptomyces glomeratus]